MTEGSGAAQEPAQDNSPVGESSVRTVAVEAGDALVGRIIALADEYSSTLGFLPHSAFEAAARSGTLLAAVQGTDLVGYALFALPR